MARTFHRMDQILKLTQQHKVGLAIENSSSGHAMPDAEALIRLLDRYPDQAVGVCWDTGHANINRPFKQSDELRKLGQRLKALHVADNAGRGDDHLAPYMGTIDWPDILQALKDIDYQGTFNFECHNQAIRIMDPDLRLSSIRLIHKIGLNLIRQYEQMGINQSHE
jgi:sugar phosphate isomerase/epimerase